MTAGATLSQRPHRVATRAARGASQSSSEQWPNYLLLVSFLVVVVRFTELIGPLRFLKPALICATLGTGAHLLWTSRREWSRLWNSRIFRLVLWYLAAILLSIPFSIWRGKSVGLLQTLPFSISVLLFAGLLKPSEGVLDRVLRQFAVAVSLTAIVVLARGEVVEGSRITSGASYDPNDLAALFAIAIPLAIGAALRARALSKLLYLAVACVLVLSLLMTGSRGGLIALVVSAIVFMVQLPPRRMFAALLIVAVATPAVWVGAPDVMKERAATLLSLKEDYNTTSTVGRVYLWSRGLSFALEKPIVGSGASTFEERLGRDFAERGQVGAWKTAHNTYIQVAAELGFPGFIALMLLFGGVFRAFAKVASTPKANRPELLASLAGYCTAIVFLSHGYSYILFGLIAIGMIAENTVAEMAPRGMSIRRHRMAHGARPIIR